MKILGINNEMYISSACLIEDGKILAAAAEERFSRNKRTRKFPTNSINYCLQESNISISNIDYIATSWNPSIYFSKFNPLYSGQRRHHLEQTYSVIDNVMTFYRRPKFDYLYQSLSGDFGDTKIYHITHHRAHAANGFFLSPFDSAAILTADAQGEFESTTFCHGKKNKIILIKSIDYPQSLGALYSTFTEYLGFKANSEEWKVMAMGAYANNINRFYNIIKEQVIKFSESGFFELNLNFFNGYMHEQPYLYSEKFEDTFGPARKKGEELNSKHFEIAAALQKISEEAVIHLINCLYQQTKEKNLVLSGGLFMNSIINGKILEFTPFENLFISSCPDDSGNCFGAALYLYNHILENNRGEKMLHNYYGPQFTDQEIYEILRQYKLIYSYEKNIFECAAKFIADGKIVGWFQGRMEFGQRALGNRSILADPRKAEIKDKVNETVKFRENFRPFAPAVIKERQEEYFEIGQGGDIPFMEKVYRVRKEKQAEIPAVVHIDGSARIQTVIKETNEKFYYLIKEFEKISGIPVVLNTSFNLNKEPIVCSPKDAIRTFYSCGLDCLIIGNYCIHKYS